MCSIHLPHSHLRMLHVSCLLFPWYSLELIAGRVGGVTASIVSPFVPRPRSLKWQGWNWNAAFMDFSWMWLTNKAFMLPVFFLRHSALWPVALVMHGWSRRDLKMVPLCVCYCTFTELSHGNDKLACSFGLLKAVILCFLSWHILSLLNHTMKVY